MIQKDSVIDFIKNVIEVFGISILSIMVFVCIFGNDAQGISSIFRLGNEGIAVQTMLQFLELSVILTFCKWLFFTDKVIKKMAVTPRVISMIVSIIVIVGIMAGVFKWFPVNMFLPWLLFLICFAISSAISIIISKTKEKNENEKLQNALERLKKEIK